MTVVIKLTYKGRKYRLIRKDDAVEIRHGHVPSVNGAIVPLNSEKGQAILAAATR